MQPGACEERKGEGRHRSAGRSGPRNGEASVPAACFLSACQKRSALGVWEERRAGACFGDLAVDFSHSRVSFFFVFSYTQRARVRAFWPAHACAAPPHTCTLPVASSQALPPPWQPPLPTASSLYSQHTHIHTPCPPCRGAAAPQVGRFDRAPGRKTSQLLYSGRLAAEGVLTTSSSALALHPMSPADSKTDACLAQKTHPPSPHPHTHSAQAAQARPVQSRANGDR
jgi:hypothetical protein